MEPFEIALSKGLSFGVKSDGHALFKSWDKRANLHLTLDEFKALFDLLYSNDEKFTSEIKDLEKSKQGKNQEQQLPSQKQERAMLLLNNLLKTLESAGEGGEEWYGMAFEEPVHDLREAIDLLNTNNRA